MTPYAFTSEPTLDCQGCGTPLMELTPAQEQMVAGNPYNFIVYCRTCVADVKRQMRRRGSLSG